MNEPVRIKLVIKRKPPPPPLPSFVCAICENEIERDPRNPEFQQPPVCFHCSFHTPTRPRLAGSCVEHWSSFYKVHALVCAIKQECQRARSSH